MKKIFFLTSLVLITSSFVLLKSSAALESTPSAIASPPETELTETDSRIQEIKETVRQKVEEQLNQVIAEQKKIGWLGVIKMIDASIITLENSEGIERQILFNDETTIVSQKSQKLKIEDLTEGNRIVALGFQEGENIADAKRIILTEEAEINKFPLIGTISDKSQVEDLIVITSAQNKDQTLEISITAQSEIINENEEKGNYESLKKGQEIALVYQATEKINTAFLIRILNSEEN